MVILIPSVPITEEYALQACETAITKGEWEDARTWLAVWEGVREVDAPRSQLVAALLAAMKADCFSMANKLIPFAPITDPQWGMLMQCAINECHSAPAFGWLWTKFASRSKNDAKNAHHAELHWGCVTYKPLENSLLQAIHVNDALAARICYRVTTTQHFVECLNHDAPADLLWKVATERFPELKTGGPVIDDSEWNKSARQDLLKQPLTNRRTVAGAMALLLLGG